MSTETIKKYNEEIKRIAKIADTMEGASKLVKFYKSIVEDEDFISVNTAINFFARQSAVFNKQYV